MQHHRRSIRLGGYDYSQPGFYFITVCTAQRECLFGNIVDGEMVLNHAGALVQSIWNEMPDHYGGIEIDEFVVMPNHVHGVIAIVGAAPCGRPKSTKIPFNMGQPQGVAPTLSLPDVVHRFKTMTTKQYVDGVNKQGWKSFPGRLWQRNYYEHIIRNESELKNLREYIRNNPTQWELDDLFL